MKVSGLCMLWILVGGARGEWTVLMFTCIFTACVCVGVIVVIYIAGLGVYFSKRKM